LSNPTSTTDQSQTDNVEIAPSATVDPGQLIRIHARFPGEPANVLFSYLAPESNIAVHDPGSAEIGTTIIRADDDRYAYWIDTARMRGGKGWWYFYSEDPDRSKRRAKVGTFIVRNTPRALIERPVRAPALSAVGSDSGLYLLGADAPNDAPSNTKVLVGVAVGLAVGLAFSAL